MKQGYFGTAIFVFAVVVVIVGVIFIPWPEFAHRTEVSNILHSRSVLDVRLMLQYDKPPIYRESYHMRNDNGESEAIYRVEGYSGKVITLTLAPEKTYAVTFFFEQLVADGVWQLTNRPPAGKTDPAYTLTIYQEADNRHGSRTVHFTDPEYWAVAAGHQYAFGSSANGTLTLTGTQQADPRFKEVVDAFRSFGPSSFRAKVTQANATVRASH